MRKYIIFGSIGALAGLAFFYFLGCNIGTCTISTSPIKSTLLGLIVGLFLALDLKPAKKDNNPEEIENEGEK